MVIEKNIENIIKQNYDKKYHLEEKITVFMLVLINILILMFSDYSVTTGIFILNILIITCIAVTPHIQRTLEHEWFDLFRDWYVYIIIGLIYMQYVRLVPFINPHEVDNIIIRIDKFLFLGNHPTLLLEQITYPVITEILQVVYASFSLMPAILCLLLYIDGRKVTFHIVLSLIMIGFYSSYIGYYIAPAIGPRFTLAHLQNLELRGILTYDFISSTLNYFEGVKDGVYAHDCCPSGHTLIAILVAALSFRYRKSIFHIILPWSMLLIFSTVYLRYHYVLDLIAGAAVAAIIIRFAPRYVERVVIHDNVEKIPDPAKESFIYTKN